MKTNKCMCWKWYRGDPAPCTVPGWIVRRVSKKTEAPCQILGAGTCGRLVANQSLLSFLSRTRDTGEMKVKGGVKGASMF